jgi:hypothetical protein
MLFLIAGIGRPAAKTTRAAGHANCERVISLEGKQYLPATKGSQERN